MVFVAWHEVTTECVKRSLVGAAIFEENVPGGSP